jgi:hypothetical protein
MNGVVCSNRFVIRISKLLRPQIVRTENIAQLQRRVDIYIYITFRYHIHSVSLQQTDSTGRSIGSGTVLRIGPLTLLNIATVRSLQ